MLTDVHRPDDDNCRNEICAVCAGDDLMNASNQRIGIYEAQRPSRWRYNLFSDNEANVEKAGVFFAHRTSSGAVTV